MPHYNTLHTNGTCYSGGALPKKNSQVAQHYSHAHLSRRTRPSDASLVTNGTAQRNKETTASKLQRPGSKADQQGQTPVTRYQSRPTAAKAQTNIFRQAAEKQGSSNGYGILARIGINQHDLSHY